MKTLFASKAEVGQKYLTKNGYPVEVIENGAKGIWVKTLANGGKRIRIYPENLLMPYSEKAISKDARIAMTRAVKALTHAVTDRISELKGVRHLKATYQGKDYSIEVKPTGFYYDGISYKSTTALATKITGHPTSGPTFFGLRKRGK